MKSKNLTMHSVEHFPFLLLESFFGFFPSYLSFNLHLYTWTDIPLPTDPKRYSSQYQVEVLLV